MATGIICARWTLFIICLIFTGILVAIIPAAVGFVGWTILDSVSLPGSADYAFIPAAFPFLLARAVGEQA